MVAPQRSRPSGNGCTPEPRERLPRRRVNKLTSYGIALVMLMLFKFLLTGFLGVAPDPALSLVNVGLGCAGVVLILLGIRADRQRRRNTAGHSPFDSPSTEEEHPR